MTLDENTKKLRDEVYAVIERKEQDAYMKGYTKGLAVGVKDSEDLRNIVNKWICGFNSKLKDAPSAMDGMSVAPVPCVNGMAGKTVKDFLQKFDEEVDEWKQEVFSVASLDDEMSDVKELLTGYDADELDTEKMRRIAEEAADICTVLASFMEAAGIGFEMRQEAQRRVNEHNKERGRW